MHDNTEVGNQEYGGIYPPDTYPVAGPQNVPEYEKVVEP